MRALLLGRPSHLHEDNYSARMPSVDDAQYVDEGDPITATPEQIMSLSAFVANCKLVPIIDQ
jgi:hypothetical protein